MMTKIKNTEMANNSAAASIEGVRMVSAKAREAMKEELLNFINRSGRQVVLNLKHDTSLDTWGTVKLIAELAKLTEIVSFDQTNCKKAFHALNIQTLENNHVCFNN